MSKSVIEIIDWVDLHRLCMASRSTTVMYKLDCAIDSLASAKMENEDRCFGLMRDYIRDARNHLDDILKELADTESFAQDEVHKRFTPINEAEAE